jgi:hypothetical protein
MAELVDSPLHRFHRRARERLGHITDPASNQPLCRFWIRFAKFPDAPAHFRKEISGLKLEVVFI